MKNSARFSFEEDENSRSYTEDLDEDGEKSAEDAEEKAFLFLFVPAQGTNDLFYYSTISLKKQYENQKNCKICKNAARREQTASIRQRNDGIQMKGLRGTTRAE